MGAGPGGLRRRQGRARALHRLRRSTTSRIAREDDMVILMRGLLAAAAFGLMSAPTLAADKVLAIVVKGLDNPFFEQIHKGCEKWNGENTGKGYTCFYTGPASSADEAGEIQIVDDLLNKPDIAAIAISPSNAPLMAKLLR